MLSFRLLRCWYQFIFDSHVRAMWVYGMAKALGRPAVYRTFSTNHLSYIKTLVPIYIFRAITFFWWCRHFLRKNGLFAPKLKKNLLWTVFREALIVASPFLDMCLDIFGAWINQKNLLIGTLFRKYSIFCKKWIFKTKTFLCHGPNIHHQAFFIN